MSGKVSGAAALPRSFRMSRRDICMSAPPGFAFAPTHTLLWMTAWQDRHGRGSDMRRREFIAAIGGAAAWPLVARAQRPMKVPRIGVLWQGANAETHPYFKPLRDGFKAAGYGEGSLIFEDRFFDKNSENIDL